MSIDYHTDLFCEFFSCIKSIEITEFSITVTSKWDEVLTLSPIGAGMKRYRQFNLPNGAHVKLSISEASTFSDSKHFRIHLRTGEGCNADVTYAYELSTKTIKSTNFRWYTNEEYVAHSLDVNRQIYVSGQFSPIHWYYSKEIYKGDEKAIVWDRVNNVDEIPDFIQKFVIFSKY
jgi:hypothetical protein